jgi:hypothetical protein
MNPKALELHDFGEQHTPSDAWIAIEPPRHTAGDAGEDQ